MATHTIYRKANVSRAEATTALFDRFPNADLLKFEEIEKNGVRAYAATIRVAEFPPGGGSDDSPEEKSGPKPEKSESSDDKGSDDTETSDSPESSDEDKGGGAPFGGDDDADELGKPKKLSPEEETVHLLHQILDAIKGGGLGGPAAGGPGDLDLPDIGAPGQGDTLPPPGSGPAGGAPLPPPVKEKSPMGAGAFAHVADQAEIHVVREDARKVGNRTLIAEAATVFPNYRVAQIQTTGFATINGEERDLAEAGLAVVKLVRKS